MSLSLPSASALEQAEWRKPSRIPACRLRRAPIPPGLAQAQQAGTLERRDVMAEPSDGSTGAIRDNLTSGVPNPYPAINGFGYVDAGNNH